MGYIFVQPGTVTLDNTGLHILDTDSSHDLIVAPGSNLTADRTLTVTTGDADRAVTLSGNLTVDGTTTITAAAATVLDDATVAAMVDTLGGATSTGSGGLVRATSPTLVTPVLGVASATSLIVGSGALAFQMESHSTGATDYIRKVISSDHSHGFRLQRLVTNTCIWSIYAAAGETNLRIGDQSSDRIYIQNGTGNVGIMQSSWGTSAQRVLAISSGTAPSTSPADCFQLYSRDITAGNAAPHFRTEAGIEIRLYQQAHVADPSGGATQDAEARTAINAILDTLENLRLHATS